MTDTPTAMSGQDLVETLLPSTSSAALDALSATVFSDGAIDVAVSPVDQLATAFLRKMIDEPHLGGAGVIELPRWDQRAAVFLAICTQILLRQNRTADAGPVVLVSSDLKLAEQLRTMSVRNHRRMGLADGNPLSAHRLTRAGALQPLLGNRVCPVSSALIYYNTRVGSPVLACVRPVVIIDGTTVKSPDARLRAARWAKDHGAVTTIMVGDVGDAFLRDSLIAVGHEPVELIALPDVIASLEFNLGRRPATASPLASMPAMWHAPTVVGTHVVDAPEINSAIERCYRALAAKPAGEPPYELDNPLKLFRNGTRLAASVADYKAACANNIRPGEGPVALLRRLDKLADRFVGPWRSWGVSHWGTLRTSVRSMWEVLERSNPKVNGLWSVLDRESRARPGRILIRCHSRAAAEATRLTLSSGPRSDDQIALWSVISDRVTVARFTERFPAGHFATQILTGAPPPWHFSTLTGIEADATIVIVYRAELDRLEHQSDRWAYIAEQRRQAACKALGATRPAPVAGPVRHDTTSASAGSMTADLSTFTLSLAEILDRAGSLIDAPERPASDATTATIGGSRECVPVRLTDGRTWWVINEGQLQTPVLTVTAGGHATVMVGQLNPGDSVVVPAGDGTESVHARLLAASRSNTEVASLDMILSQFRLAARHVLRSVETYQKAVDLVIANGGLHAPQLRAWADGSTIAPREPGDVAAVFAAARRPSPNLNVLYSVATALRDLSRRLGQFVAAIAGGTNRDAVDKLRALVGDFADELVDEFVIAQVESVGHPTAIAAHLAGRLR
jgi:hypothetical protein